MSEVAIFSTSIDEPTFGPVLNKLESKGVESWVFMADKVASGEHSFSTLINEDGELVLNYNDRTCALHAVRSAWFRHPYLSGLKTDDIATRLSLEHEIDSLQESMWQEIPEKSWLNDPNKMRLAQAKLSQLVLAKGLGFNIPDSIVANNWHDIDHALGRDQVIMKMPKGVLHTKETTKVLYCTVLDEQKRKTAELGNPYPGIFQKYQQKKREWRITVVGDDTFPVAVYTSDDAKDDWRKYQLTSKVSFKQEVAPDNIEQQCVDFLGKIGLSYGAFDLVESDEGEITFLECNTNGQFRWLEDTLNLPISDSIVTHLIRKLSDGGT